MTPLLEIVQRADLPQLRLRLRHWGEYLAFRTAMGALRLVPLDLSARMLAMACRMYSSRSRRHRRALANIAVAMPEKTAAEREAIVLAMWENVGRVIAEAAHIDTFLAEPHRLDVVDLRTVDEHAERKGLYVIAGIHTGNWEIGLLHTHRRGYTPAAFYRTIANPLVDRFIRDTRQQIYSGGMFPMRGERGDGARPEMRSRQLVASLRSGVPIGILMDHYDPSGVAVPFFGHSVRVSRGPATLAMQFRARMCIARTIRVGRQSRFVAEAEEIVPASTGDRNADIEATTAAMMRRFEDWIRQFPEQWLWSQAPFVTSDGHYLGGPVAR